MKKRSKRIGILIALCMVLTLILSACGSKSGGNDSSGVSGSAAASSPAADSSAGSDAGAASDATGQFSNDPVTLKVATPWSEDYFKSRIGDYMAKKLPHITLEPVHWDGTEKNMQELTAKGIVPDVVLAYTGQKPLEDLEMVYPLDDMLQKYNFDINTLNPKAVADIRSRDAQGRFIGLPEEIGFLGLFYNKEIFDKFGVSYPTESMTWDQVLDLAKSLTVERDGIKYRGLEFGEAAPLLEMGVPLTDPDTGDVLLTKEPEVTKYMELMKNFYSIPGMYDPDSKGSFMDKTVAMSVNWHGFLTWFGGQTADEAVEFQKQMDVVPLPYWPDKPETSTVPIGIHPWEINSFSKNKEAALQFILESVSPEYQTILAKAGTPSVLADTSLNTKFGEDLPQFKGKNIGAFMKYNLVEPPARGSYWDRFVSFDLKKFAESDKNVQEFLRTTSEEAAAKIKDAQSKLVKK